MLSLLCHICSHYPHLQKAANKMTPPESAPLVYTPPHIRKKKGFKFRQQNTIIDTQGKKIIKEGGRKRIVVIAASAS